MKRIFIAFLSFLFASVFLSEAQIYTLGADPSSIKWKSLESENFRLVYPESADSLAHEYARSLESFVQTTRPSIGFSPNELYKKKLPVILHSYTAVANGMVSWAPRRMELYTNAEFYDPESTPWMQQLTVHEGRHVAQMQFPRAHKLFKPLEIFIGELSTGLATALYPSTVLMEGDAVVAETALSKSGRGRTADFLSFYHVSLADSLYRDFWQWRYGSQRLFTPDHYRAGYMMVAGMRTAFDDAEFSKRYYQNINSRFLPRKVLQKTVKQGSGMKLDEAFTAIQDSFRAEWAEADSLRAPFIEGEDVIKSGRLFGSYSSLVFTDDGLFALYSALDKALELVRIDSTGRVESMGAFASYSSRLAYDRFNRRLIWSEYKPSAMMALKSWSVLRYIEDGGRIRTFERESRLYNPAPNTEKPMIAAIQAYEDGTHSVKLMAANHCTTFQEYYAPAHLQPVEAAWVGDEVYVSAISEEGFSIYHVPDWKPVFAPAHSKINRLFGRDGLVWFTSDRSGVNELHSLDPATGEILQRTSLRFGGSEFAFSPEGDLYYCALTSDGRVVRRLEADQLLAIPVEFNAIQVASAEKLSAQEELGSIEYEGPVSEGKPYSKLTQPFKLHSWAPLYIEYNPIERLTLEEPVTDATLGATAMFQNELGTAYGSIGVALLDSMLVSSTPHFRPSLHAQYVWNGWGPVVELRADYNERDVLHRTYTRESTETGMSFPETTYNVDKPLLNLTAGFSLPFNLGGGGWSSGIIPRYRISWSNDQLASLDVEQFTNTVKIKIVDHNYNLLSKFSVSAYAYRPIANSQIFPRYGIGTELGFTRTHTVGSIIPGYYYAKLYGYLPGLMSTHGLRLYAEGRSNYGWEGEWIKTQNYELSADYAFPFLPLDWSGLCPYFYVRNLEAVIHGTASLGSYEELLRTKKGSTAEYSAGLTIRAHLGNFLMAPYDTYIGVRGMYNFTDSSKSGVEAVFSLDL